MSLSSTGRFVAKKLTAQCIILKVINRYMFTISSDMNVELCYFQGLHFVFQITCLNDCFLGVLDLGFIKDGFDSSVSQLGESNLR